MDNGQAYPGGQQVPVGNNQAFAPGPVGLGRTQPISSGTGDIILQPEKKRSTKKRWIAGVVAGIIVAVITLLVLLASRSGQVNGKSISEYAKDYLSLLAIGESSDGNFSGDDLELSKISSGDLENIYVIPRSYSSLDEKNAAYYNKLQELLDKIKSGSDEDDLAFWTGDSKTMLSYYFAASVLAYTNSDYEYYLKNKNLDGLLSVYGYPFVETDDELLLVFSNTINMLYNSKKEFYDEVSKTNCVKDDGIDYSCLSEIGSAQIEAIKKRNSALTASEEIQTEKMLGLIVADARGIYSLVEGGADE